MKNNEDTIILTSIAPSLTEKSSVRVSYITESTRMHKKKRRTDFPSVWICLDGECTLHVENKDFCCHSGTVVVVPPGVLYYPESGGHGSLSLVRLSTEFNAYADIAPDAFLRSVIHLLLPAFSEELGFQPVCTVNLSESSFDKAKNLLASPSLSSVERFFSLPEFKVTETQMKIALSVFSKRLLPILKAMTYIQKNYSQRITSEDLTKECGLCRTNLFVLFKKYLNVSPLTYLVMIRVIRAQFALSHTKYSLQYISDMCGFSDCSHMDKCYKKYKGFLPSEDRAQMKAYRKRYPDIYVSHNYFFKD